jgi:hypothetical protein
MDASQKEDQVGHGRAAMNHKRCVHLTIIGNPVTLDQVLEAYDIGDGFLREPYKVFITGVVHS